MEDSSRDSANGNCDRARIELLRSRLEECLKEADSLGLTLVGARLSMVLDLFPADT